VQRSHQRSGQRLVQRVLSDLSGQRVDHHRRIARAQLDLRPQHEGVDALLLPDLSHAGRPLARHLRDRRTAPQRQPVTQQFRTQPVRFPGSTGPHEELMEPVHVHRLRVDVEHVPACPADQRHGGEQPAQASDIDVNRVAHLIGRRLSPHPVHDGIHHHELSGVCRKRRQHTALPRWAQFDQMAVIHLGLNCSEQAEPHHASDQETQSDLRSKKTTGFCRTLSRHARHRDVLCVVERLCKR